jgi:hypothetical protein
MRLNLFRRRIAVPVERDQLTVATVNIWFNERYRV